MISTGSLEEGRSLCEESLAVAAPGSGPRVIALLNLAFIETAERRHPKAEALTREAIEIALARGDLVVVAEAAIMMARPLAERRQFEWSARLLGAGTRFLETAGVSREWMEHASEAAVSDILRTALDPENVDALLTEGGTRPLEKVVGDALSDLRH